MRSLARERSIDRFLANRRQLLVDFVKLSAAVEHRQRDIAEVLLLRCCQSLVDYLSDGYFRIYGDLLSSRAWSTPRDYARFEATTAGAMGFNDRFGGAGTAWTLSSLRGPLAKLGLALETRFELEDRLLRDARPRPAIGSRAARVGEPVDHLKLRVGFPA